MTIIEVKNVSFSYPNGFEAVKNVSFNISAGENIAIVGQNGAGKTTTVKLLNGLLKPSKGDVVVNNQNTKEYTTAQISRKVGYVFQNPDDQIFNNTVYDEIAYALRKMGFDEDEVEDKVYEVAQLTEIEGELDENPYDLPLSIRKFVTIASVIATEPDVLIFDEPTAGQDLRGLKVLSNIIEELIRQNKAVITISHDMEYVAENFEKIIVMANKKIQEIGLPENIFFNESLMDIAMLNPPEIVSISQKLGVKLESLSIDELEKHCRKLLSVKIYQE